MTSRDLLGALRVDLPILQAPMGGGPSTAALVSAVSDAGGMGWMGSAYQTPDEILAQAEQVRERTDRPFGINLFAGGWNRRVSHDLEPMLGLLSETHAALGLAPPVVPPLPIDPFPAQLEAVLEVRPAMFSFTFGLPRDEELRRLRHAGILVAGTATTVREAKILKDSGVDAVFVQGAEAGAHRGTFAGAFETAMHPTLELVRAVKAAVDLPLIASGGLMDGGDIARALEAGASAGALGTAFLVTPESGAPEAHKAAVMNAVAGRSVVTRAFSGRPARGLPNGFISRAEALGQIPPYPLQNALTRPMRAAAAKAGQADYLSLWAGSEAHRARPMPAGDLVRLLTTELRAARNAVA